MSNKRLFVGIPIPPELEVELSSIGKQFNYPFWNWTKPSNLHVTLCFIGNVKVDEVEVVINKLSKIIVPSFQLVVDKIIPVIRKRRLDMIWTSFKVSEEFNLLSKEIHQTLGIELEREPKPHITLCRVKALNKEKVSENDFPIIENTILAVNSFILYESKTEGKGPTYIKLQTYN